MTATATTTWDRWTVVTRDKGGRFYRPVAGAVPGTWDEAREQARRLASDLQAAGDTTTQVWYVPTQDTPQIPEDRDNVLEYTGRRVPIRWDAAPRHALRKLWFEENQP